MLHYLLRPRHDAYADGAGRLALAILGVRSVATGHEGRCHGLNSSSPCGVQGRMNFTVSSFPLKPATHFSAKATARSADLAVKVEPFGLGSPRR